ncbi:hypothetical protein ACFOQM_15500 [Paenibacillus sp. GCM10012307]|uniref:Uncharacterized protein n=1 Tax=Paenibacillus roseus TaxID=2798579 RepID=A0A934MLW4_9BACL|nr:hypothetical protein [Paenibacillus roseus]MBJ6362650.1 hypothetical protein [Paenibacillus roseus]
MKLRYKFMLIRICFLPFIIYYAVLISRISFFKLQYTAGNVLLAILPLPLIIALAIAVYSKWLKKTAKAYMSIFVVMGIVFCLISISLMGYNLNHTKFDYNKWVGSPQLRMDIVDHMLNKYGLEGRSKDGVIQLLGLPDQPGTSLEAADSSLFVYHLGAGTVTKDDRQYYLAIRFNQEDQVENYSIYSNS